MKNHTPSYLRRQQLLFCQTQKASELYQLLNFSNKEYKELTDQPKYNSFFVGKKTGGERHIETPNYKLKKIQERLNKYLQAVYYFYKTPVAFGFLINSTTETDRRDILTNAQKHLDNDFVLNLDLKNFFHTINVPKVWDIFKKPPFRLQRPAVEMLTRLTTFRGRLPMGTPTSPVLSNFATRKLDADLLEYCTKNNLTLSRYADDISISSKEKISPHLIENFKIIILQNDFEVNEKKIKLYEKDEPKEITGLILENKQIRLPTTFIPEILEEINQLKSTLVVQNQQGKLHTNWVEEYQKQIQGKINFVGYILGQKSPEKLNLDILLEEALEPPIEDFGSYSWRSFMYRI